jgi:uncharacterized membrane protein YgaE (UPF0421/DUF939 family)
VNLRYKSLFIYISKIAAAVLLISWLAHFVPFMDYSWCLISSVLVLSPEGKDSVELALTRIKGNFVGASCGLIMLALQIESPYNIILATALSLIVCDQLKLNAGARSTLAAAVIVLLHQEGTHIWDGALGRVIAVIAGCIISLAITFLFHSIFKIEIPTVNSEKKSDS